jgi:hypothetical protein
MVMSRVQVMSRVEVVVMMMMGRVEAMSIVRVEVIRKQQTTQF